MIIGINNRLSNNTSFGITLHKTKELKTIAKLAQKEGKQQDFNNAVNLLELSPLKGDVLVTTGKIKTNDCIKSYSSIFMITPHKKIKTSKIISTTNHNPIDLALNHFLGINDKNSSIFKTLFSD